MTNINVVKVNDASIDSFLQNSYQENPEWIKVVTDSEDKILEGTRTDGTKVVATDLEVDGNVSVGETLSVETLSVETLDINSDARVIGDVELAGCSYTMIENPEWIKVLVDSEDRILCGIRRDGTFCAQIEGIDEKLQEAIERIEDEVDDKFALFNEVFSVVDNPEFISVETDAEGKILSYRDSDGVMHENVGIKAKDVKAENLTFNISTGDTLNVETLNLSIDGQKKLQEEIVKMDNINLLSYQFNLPKYGTVNITQEQFFLEYNENVSSISDVVLIQDYPISAENAYRRISTAHYYVNDETIIQNSDGTYSASADSTRLMFFAFEKVKLNSDDNNYYAKVAVRRIGSKCYYTDTLILNSLFAERVTVLEGYSVEYPFDSTMQDGETKMSTIRVTPISGTPCIEAWTVEDFDSHAIANTDIGKKYNHRCVVSIDFGDYYAKSPIYMDIKFQGNSTNSYKKRNFRFTFYKNSSYAKKDKIKIGEMIRLSGYNLKAELYGLVGKSSFLYRTFNNIWNSRPITDRFDWDNNVNSYYHGATGIIKDYPIQLNIGSSFYGIYFFGLKKDEKNYMLDGTDESGFFVIGKSNGNNVWGETLPYNVTDYYEDEMLDELSQSTINALTNWHHFLNNRLYLGSDSNEYNSTELTDIDGTMYVTSTLEGGQPVASSVSATLIEFNKKNAWERVDIIGFIDYFICLQVFLMADSFFNNMILYSNSEKKKVFPFFYDVNGCEGVDYPYTVDYLEVRGRTMDVSFWENFKDMYWDDIITRYNQLRKGPLSMDALTYVYNNIVSSIPESDITQENTKWDLTHVKSEYKTQLNYTEKRLNWLDKNYFI